MPEKTFYEKVYALVKNIPPGRITTYGAIATHLGTKSSARMVGWALNAAHNRTDIPAHRVVNRHGLLTGKHHFGFNPMQKLLEKEGIEVIDDKIQNFEQLFWTPEIN